MGGGAVHAHPRAADFSREEALDAHSIIDPGLRTRKAARAAQLGGSTLVGSVLGGVLGGGVGGLLGGPAGYMTATAAGKAALAVTGATVAYQRKRREQLKLGVSIPPSDVRIPPFWAARANEIRELSVFRVMHATSGADEQTSQELVDECALEERVNVFVARCCLDPSTLPGALFRALVLDFKERHGMAAGARSTGSDIDPATAEEDGPAAVAAGAEAFSAVLDALGLTHQVISASFHYHPVLGRSDESAAETINAVDRLCFGEIYEAVFWDLVQQCSEADEALAAVLVRVVDLVPRGAWCSEEALRALAETSRAKTALDKMRCLGRFVDCVGSTLAGSASADDLVPALLRHVAVGGGGLRLHAELAFTERFCRDDLLLIGQDGYVLTSMTAAVTSLRREGHSDHALRALLQQD